jgi:hypothetical protein
VVGGFSGQVAVGTADQTASMPGLNAVEVFPPSSALPAKVVVAVPRAVVRTMAIVICWLVGAPTPARTPTVMRRTFSGIVVEPTKFPNREFAVPPEGGELPASADADST